MSGPTQGIPCQCIAFWLVCAYLYLCETVWMGICITDLSSEIRRNCHVRQRVSVFVHEQAQVANFFAVMSICLACTVAMVMKFQGSAIVKQGM